MDLKTHRRSNEPLWWAPFSAGMMVDALTLPALVVITGFLLPYGYVSENIAQIMVHPIARLVLFGIISLSFFHAAHRTRFVLADLGLKAFGPALAILFYGAAIAGTIYAGVVAFSGM